MFDITQCPLSSGKCGGFVRNELNGAIFARVRFGDTHECKGNIKSTNHFLDSLHWT